ncbi:alpha/beta fold hydrolase [Micromonospora coxensis]|uniref:Pimeloyl-ACP methyl ester carboxylesterase n=1 Tax=Micromonospora coxensis TaxID=356852 RepID=A0A1C5GL37_9ACTN|nr:alpha/beta hydrolase [Micromonospora coxensis]SCG34514.1 Pimeloyl-ACP methyl ester carboxylesterase [Micromonospora coxensis]
MHSPDPTRLVHCRRGAGPPLVLIHGIGSRWQVWQPVLDELARHRDVIALDLPGFGASPPWPDPGPGVRPGSVDHLADRVAAFLDTLGVSGYAVAGNSLGGGVALELGRRGAARAVTAFSPIGFWGPLGRRWCRLVVGGARAAGTALRPALPRAFAHRAGRVALCGVFHGHPGRLTPAECVSAAAALAGAPGFAAARSAFGDWQLHPEPDDAATLAAPADASRTTPTAADRRHPPAVRDRAGQPGHGGRPGQDGRQPGQGGGRPGRHRGPGALAAIPVTIAWGTRDLVLPYRSQARRARTALPAARHVALPGCGHLPFADSPETCARLLIETC